MTHVSGNKMCGKVKRENCSGPKFSKGHTLTHAQRHPYLLCFAFVRSHVKFYSHGMSIGWGVDHVDPKNRKPEKTENKKETH